MRSMTRLLALVSIAVGLVAAPVLAAPTAKGQKPSVSAHGPKTTGQTSAPKGTTMKAAATTSRPAQGPKAQGAKTGTTSGKSAKAGKTGTSGTPTPGATTTGTTAQPGTTGGTWTPDNPIAQKLSTKTNILNRAQGTLPLGTDLNAATAGFKNFGQFVAAVNVSNNLGIPFADLKASMTGLKMDGTSTGKPTASLGQSIQQLRPGVDADIEAHKAETDAARMIDEQPPATGKTTPKKNPRGF